MAKLIIVDNEKIKASLTRFRRFLQQNPNERARLEGLHQSGKAGDEGLSEQAHGAEAPVDKSETRT